MAPLLWVFLLNAASNWGSDAERGGLPASERSPGPGPAVILTSMMCFDT